MKLKACATLKCNWLNYAKIFSKHLESVRLKQHMNAPVLFSGIVFVFEPASGTSKTQLLETLLNNQISSRKFMGTK